MSLTHSHVRPNTTVFFRLSSGILKLVEIKPNTIIDIGKFGSFPSHLLLGRPYHRTYELLERQEGEACSRLRLVSPSELNTEVILEDDDTPNESRDEPAVVGPPTNLPGEYDLIGEGVAVVAKDNRRTIDDASRQALSQQDIESLKKTTGGKEIIEKILANHSGLDEKTVFSKAKYTLRKSKKYLKRFTVLPMDVNRLLHYVSEKEPSRILELREETLGLVCAWSNVHCYPEIHTEGITEHGEKIGGGRWLIVDETGGLVVAAMAERMGILHPSVQDEGPSYYKSTNGTSALPEQDRDGDAHMTSESSYPNEKAPSAFAERQPISHLDFPIPASTNTLTLLHPAVQPNLSLLKYFGYDTNSPTHTHPLHLHMKPLSWLQLLHPQEDPTYVEPETISDQVLQSWKSGKRGNYWKKRRRWERCKSIVDEARAGGFEGLVVASNMDPVTILPHAVPLVRGGGHVVVYSPTIEPLVKLIDLYSKERRTAYINILAQNQIPDPEDFPLDPRLLLAPTLQTSRVRAWQVLPGRTHPLMTARGGAEGYVFTARRVVPIKGGVEARGNYAGKKKKVEDSPMAALAGETAGLAAKYADEEAP